MGSISPMSDLREPEVSLSLISNPLENLSCSVSGYSRAGYTVAGVAQGPLHFAQESFQRQGGYTDLHVLDTQEGCDFLGGIHASSSENILLPFILLKSISGFKIKQTGHLSEHLSRTLSLVPSLKHS